MIIITLSLAHSNNTSVACQRCCYYYILLSADVATNDFVCTATGAVPHPSSANPVRRIRVLWDVNRVIAIPSACGDYKVYAVIHAGRDQNEGYIHTSSVLSLT